MLCGQSLGLDIEPQRLFVTEREEYPVGLQAVAETVVLCLVQYAKVPRDLLRPEAALGKDLGIVDDDLDDLVVELSSRLRRTLPSPPEVATLPPVRTVRDLVEFMAGLQEC